MKKLAFVAIACCAFIQSAFGIDSRLNTSLVPFQALIDSPKTQNKLSQDDFIVGFKRVTRRSSKIGQVYYLLEVKTPRNQSTAFNNVAHCEDHQHEHSSSSNHHRNGNILSYIVTFDVSENGVGPLIYKLENIRRLRVEGENI